MEDKNEDTNVPEVVEEVVKPKKKKSPNAMPRYSISFTKKNIEQLQAIEDELGLASMSETVRSCIHATYNKTFPSYQRTSGAIANTQKEKAPATAEDKAEAIRKKRAQEKANQIAVAIGICENDLDGVVATDENDKPIMCAYYQYDGRRRFKQEIDIASVSSDLVNTQYLPNKDRVMKLQKDGNVDYDVNETIEKELGIE